MGCDRGIQITYSYVWHDVAQKHHVMNREWLILEYFFFRRKQRHQEQSCVAPRKGWSKQCTFLYRWARRGGICCCRARGTSLVVCRARALLVFFFVAHLKCSSSKQELLSGDRGAFQNGSARTRSDADTARMRKASGIMQMRQTRQMQIDEDACIRNLNGHDCHTWNLQLKCSHGDLNDTYSKTLWQFVVLERWCA